MKRHSLFLILGGGGFTILCFFMPWLKLDMTSINSFTMTSINSFTETFSGFWMAMQGLLGTISFIAASAIIGISIYILKQQTPWRFRVPVLLSSSIGFLSSLGVLRLAPLHIPEETYQSEETYQFIAVALGTNWAEGTHWAQVDGTTAEMKTQLTDLINLQFGGFGAAFGFIVALIGAWNLPKSDPSIENSE